MRDTSDNLLIMPVVRERPTITDVARLCGVTPATVSRVLNGKKKFSTSEAVRERIVATAQKLGYVPDLSARNLLEVFRNRVFSMFDCQRLVTDLRKLSIVELPTTRRMVREDLVLPASYANFYIANDVVLVPIYGEPNDDIALGVLREHFPGRRVIGIDCQELIWGLGAFHCLTQQQPAVL